MAVQDGVDLGIDGIDDGVEIGAGGFGVVFRAVQTDLGRTVAVRLLPVRPEIALRQRYARECEILRAVSVHPNLVTLVAAGFTQVDQPFLTMDYMPNGSLGDRIERDGRVPWAEAVAIIVKLADALAIAHAAGVQHRDIRPENVLIASSGEPCLADLGLARLLDIVEARTAPVSLLHAAPEVVEGRRPSESADVYSLGSTLFEMLAGSAAFDAGADETVHAVLGRIANDTVPDLRRRGVPGAVCDVVEAAMSKAPSGRPESAVALGDRLRAALDPTALRAAVAPPVVPRRVIPVSPPPVRAPDPVPVPEPVVRPAPEPAPTPPPIPGPAPFPEPPPTPAPDPAPSIEESETAESTDAIETTVAVPADGDPSPTAAGDSPRDDVLPVATTGRGAIEAEPDESSRRRGRLVRFGLGAIVALVSLVVLVVVILEGSTSRVGTPTAGTNPSARTTATTSAAPPVDRAEPLELPTVLMPSGIVVSRTWRLTGTDGDKFFASVEMSNPTQKTATDSVIEVIPKQLAANVAAVTFAGATPAIVNADPVVRYDVTLAPGARARYGYSIVVPAEGADASRLDAWKSSRDTEQAAYDVLLTAPLPKGPIKTG